MFKLNVAVRTLGFRFEPVFTTKCFFASDSSMIKKAPQNAFMRFSAKERPLVLAENPGLKVTEVAKIIGARWKTLPEAEKDDLKQLYAKEKAEYEASLTEEDIMMKKEAKEKKMADKKKRTEKKTMKAVFSETNKPKRPMSAYMLFAQTMPREGKSITEHAKEVGDRWKAMSDAEKQPFIDEYLNRKSQFLVEMQEWCINMVEAGKTEFVSKKLIDEVFGTPQFPGKDPESFFVKEQSAGIKMDKAMRAGLKQEWETLDDKQKREYTRRFEDAASSYAQRVKEWQTKLINDGYGDIVKRSK